MKKLVAEQKHVEVGEEAIDCLLDQLLEITHCIRAMWTRSSRKTTSFASE